MALVPLAPTAPTATAHGHVAPAALVLAVGPLAALVTVLVALVTGATAWSTTVPSWTVLAALISLALGVPHGAVDGRALADRPPGRRSAVLYLLVAAAAAAMVLAAPAPAFLGVVALSVWHFGTGDVESRTELAGDDPLSPVWRRLHALAAGGAPVVLPLTAAATAATLDALQPDLGGLAGGWLATAARAGTLAIVAISAAHLARSGRRAALLELLVLLTLALVVTPLLAFAVYFAFWHALRHTARLAIDDDERLTARALLDVVRSGLPALGAVALAVVIGSTYVDPTRQPGSVLWVALALVWGLTVPHMVVVAEFDRRRREARRCRDGQDRTRQRSTPGGGSETSPVSACTSVSCRKVSQS